LTFVASDGHKLVRSAQSFGKITGKSFFHLAEEAREPVERPFIKGRRDGQHQV